MFGIYTLEHRLLQSLLALCVYEPRCGVLTKRQRSQGIKMENTALSSLELWKGQKFVTARLGCTILQRCILPYMALLY